jgi:hypothetical protein
MRKGLFIVAMMASSLLISAKGHAQKTPANNYLNAGIGLGTFGLSGTGGLPITASFEHRFTDKITAGGYVGLISTTFSSTFKYMYYIVGARGSYHFNEVLNVSNPKVDLYGGASVFYRGYSFKYKDHSDLPSSYKSSGGALDFALHAGGRYMFTDNIGGYAELGYGISPLQLGVTLQF